MGKTAIERLAGLGRMRVWSVIVTIFGDAVLPRGGVAPSATLSDLTGEIGVKPEAFRVALSRLTRDDWIVRSKEGRHSFYRLSDKGMDTFGRASGRIYARAPGQVSAWQMLAIADGTAPQGFVELLPKIWLGPETDVPDGAVAVSGRLSRLPGWARDRTADPEIFAGYKTLANVLEQVLQDVRTAPPEPLQAAAIRTLAVHQWRRLVLRHGDWPAQMFPDGWQGELCRARLHDLLGALEPAAGNWLDTAFRPG